MPSQTRRSKNRIPSYLLRPNSRNGFLCTETTIPGRANGPNAALPEGDKADFFPLHPKRVDYAMASNARGV